MQNAKNDVIHVLFWLLPPPYALVDSAQLAVAAEFRRESH